MALLDPPQIVPLTDAPSQTVNITLGGQACLINVYTKSINVPIQPPGMTESDPEPVYENVNPVFLDLYVDAGATLIIGGVVCQDRSLIVIDEYLGFVGDLSIVDTQGNDDPVGAPYRLPPPELRNAAQRNLPLSFGGVLPPASGPNTIPGLGSRFLLTYWPVGTFTPGDPP